MSKKRNILAIVFLILIMPFSFGQNGLKNIKYFLLQKNVKALTLNSFENNELQEKKVYAINKNSIYSTDGRKQVAILDTTSNKLSVHNFKDNQLVELNVPIKIKAKSLFTNGHNIFIGGDQGKEKLIQYNVSSKDWFSLEIPSEVMKWRKSIDDFIVTDKYLIAIDNLIMPKYILYYNLNPFGKQEFHNYMELKTNGTYESIYFGRITENYIGLNSGTFGGYGSSEHITIYDRKNMRMSFAISTHSDERDYNVFNDFIIIKDQLVIASKKKGLGFFNIEKSHFKESDENGMVEFNEEIRASKINYKSHRGKNIVKLDIIPRSNKIVLTIKRRNGKIKHEIIEIKNASR